MAGCMARGEMSTILLGYYFTWLLFLHGYYFTWLLFYMVTILHGAAHLVSHARF